MKAKKILLLCVEILIFSLPKDYVQAKGEWKAIEKVGKTVFAVKTISTLTNKGIHQMPFSQDSIPFAQKLVHHGESFDIRLPGDTMSKEEAWNRHKIELSKNKIDSLSNRELLNIFYGNLRLYPEKTFNLIFKEIQSRKFSIADVDYLISIKIINDSNAPTQLREFAQQLRKWQLNAQFKWQLDDKIYYPLPIKEEPTSVWTWVFRIVVSFLILIIVATIVYHLYNRPLQINKPDRTFVVDEKGTTYLQDRKN